ncbi:MAG: Gfo/Idh/MocA family oxidoreductase [Bradyrhizobium sp.]|nr:Gfo/Idh/MocA family oxidoreductase [Bradyrhizobium sp.]
MTVGIGIIGAGMVGQMCHLANYVANPQCRVVALADLRPDLAAAAATKFGVNRVYRTHLELLANPEVTAVVVVTRRRATGPIVLDALNSGRHVLSEKPMAYTTEQARTLAGAARQRNLVYGIGYMKRHDAGVARAMTLLKRLRADRSLGDIISAHGWCFAGETGGQQGAFTMTAEPRPDGLVLWPDGPDWMPTPMRTAYDTFLNVYSHIINLARYVLGDSPKLVESSIFASPTAAVSLDFNGIPCTLQLANEASGVWREGLVVTFERGSLTIELPPPFADGAEARVILEDGRQTSELPCGDSWAFRRQADAFVTNILHGTIPLASGEDSVEDIALAETVWQRHAAT